jgi:hypothetical protein
MTKAIIFKDAWELAKWGAKQYGGSSKEYFAESLRLVYADLKKRNKLSAHQERYAVIDELEAILKNDPASNKAKVARTINAMRDNSEWKIEKIIELLNMAKAKVAA